MSALLLVNDEDVVCDAWLAGAERVPVTTVVAHQSRRDVEIVFRLVRARTGVWSGDLRLQREAGTPSSRRTLRPVVLILVYTGRTPGWAPRLSLRRHPALLGRQPSLDLEVLDLSVVSEERLIAGDHPVGWSLALLRAQYAGSAEFLAVLGRVLGALRRLVPERGALREHVIWCALLGASRRRREEWAMIEEAVSAALDREEASAMSRTIVEVWRDQGREEGRLASLTRQLRERLGADAARFEPRLKARDDSLLEDVAVRVVRCRSRRELMEDLERLLPPEGAPPSGQG